MITKAIINSFKLAKERNWDKVYYAFDIHGTIVQPNYKKDIFANEFYPEAKETLQMISSRQDIVPFLFTCSHRPEIIKYLDYFKSHDIIFKYANENLDVPNFSYGNYDKKPYFNVIVEDKAGFDPYTDWIEIQKILQKFPIDYLKK